MKSSQFETVKKLLILVILCFSFSSFARDGGGTSAGGGGGGYILVDGQPQLIDYHNFPGLKDHLQKVFASYPPSRIASEQSISFFKDLTNNAARVAYFRLKQWADSDFDFFANRILNTLNFDTTDWNFTRQSIPSYKHFVPAFLPRGSSPMTMAYYRAEHRPRVDINLDIWNQLFLEDQVGLMVHESLRRVQITLGIDFNDESLQKATSLLMICPASTKYSMLLFKLLVSGIQKFSNFIPDSSYEDVLNECLQSPGSTAYPSLTKTTKIEKAQSLDKIDSTIQLALAADLKNLIGSGKLKFQYAYDLFPVKIETPLVVYGIDAQETSQRMGLLCLKLRCPHAGKVQNYSWKTLFSTKESSISELMLSQGLDEKQIEQNFQRFKNYQPEDYDSLSCLEVEPRWRQFIFDSCFATPMKYNSF